MTDGILEPDFPLNDAAEHGSLSCRSLAAPVQCAASPGRAVSGGGTYHRARAHGKFLYVGNEKLYVRGVTYGPFAPGQDECEYGTRASVSDDFTKMHHCGLNAVRVYSPPPVWLLDAAHEAGLHVMVGLPWQQHVTFLEARHRRDIRNRVREAVMSCAGHPAILCYAIGNEIPAPIVRWYGPRRVERWLHSLYDTVKQIDPGAMVTYVNYPSTEYLDLSFADLVAFNVYLETRHDLQRYLGRLQNIASDRPLLMAELGLDARHHGVDKQAESLESQITTALSSGCAGAFVFSWTDEWHRAGRDIVDWNFGITDRTRIAKPALEAVSRAFAQAPLQVDVDWPRVSVVVCTHNGGRTLEESLTGVGQLVYPNYEVIVVDDGSVDDTAEIARRFPVTLIRTSNKGLSHARNVGLRAAHGEIVAYLDDDAYPDPQWLQYLVASFGNSAHAGIGGPNIPPPSDPPIAQCVARAPGGPTHVLLDDSEAEHIPGCNMAFRRDRLLAVGGFDPQFRVAGDDVDICWRLREQGWTLGFSPAAVVWHHRRAEIRAYLRQQLNYGRAEAMLERKWPQKYNAAGHLMWAGRLYGNGYLESLPRVRQRIYHGTWGTALFQSVYHPRPSLLRALPTLPEWYALTAILLVVSAASMVLPSLRWVTMLPAAAGLATLACAVDAGLRAQPDFGALPWPRRFMRRGIVIVLHLMQPAVRQIGRTREGLTPWRLRGVSGFALPRWRTCTHWSERWRSTEERLADLETELLNHKAVVIRGGNFDRWDLELRGGMLASARLRMTSEEHGAGHQLVRFRLWPRLRPVGVLTAITIIVAAATVGILQGRVGLETTIAPSALLLILIALRESAASMATLLRGLRAEERRCES
jgi:GT2 family glycosyltransferase